MIDECGISGVVYTEDTMSGVIDEGGSIQGQMDGEGNLVGEVGFPKCCCDYDELVNRPSINGVELVGNKTTEDLGIEAGVQSVNGQTGDVVLDIPTKTSNLTNDSGFITDTEVPSYEQDPVFSNSVAHGITSSDITNWNNKSDFSGSYNDLTDKPTIPTVNNATLTIQKNGTDVQTFTANASSDAVANISVPTDTNDLTNGAGFITSADLPTDLSDLNNDLNVSDFNNDAGYITGMYIGSYGHSTYAEVLAAYQANKVVYCRASSNSDPATGNQLRMAFLAYVNDQTTPTEFEFQYYRSVATHSNTQQGDQVYVYKLNKNTGWSVTVREAYTKIVAGTGLTSSYSNGVLTISLA